MYLDPPFNSNRTYNVLFKHKTGNEVACPDRGVRRHLDVEPGGLRRTDLTMLLDRLPAGSRTPWTPCAELLGTTMCWPTW